jgi:16S rRNA C967 or C1407 C5-methylase (RsmB/RsmF family)
LNEILLKNEKFFYTNDNLRRFNWSELDNIYQINKLDKSLCSELKELLKRENDLGILRQELVSMIPVSLVEIKEDYIILDMCAAPGNKSVQILEVMQEKARLKGVSPSGVLISNELDRNRCEKLINFLNCQPTLNVVTTQYPAQNFPLYTKEEHLLPDIIFCDVPCSGDGTLRKNKGLRRRWKPEYGLRNHVIQIEILSNAINLCKKDGLIVYSTCAINPLENEAVIAHILEKYSNNIELVDVNEKVQKLGLNFSQALIKWKVPIDWDKKCSNIQWAYDYPSQDDKKKLKKIEYVKESMFHEIYTKKNHQNNIYFSDPLNLRRCLRFYSNQNNSGSFFICVLKKKENIEGVFKPQSIPLNIGQTKFTSISDDLDEFMKFLGVEDKIEKKEEVKITGGEEEIIRFDKFVPFSGYSENYKKLIEFFGMHETTEGTDKILNSLYTYRQMSNKVFLFSEKLRLILPLFSDINLPIITAGMTVFQKERGHKLDWKKV